MADALIFQLYLKVIKGYRQSYNPHPVVYVDNEAILPIIPFSISWYDIFKLPCIAAFSLSLEACSFYLFRISLYSAHSS